MPEQLKDILFFALQVFTVIGIIFIVWVTVSAVFY